MKRLMMVGSILGLLVAGKVFAGECCYSAAKDFWCEGEQWKEKGNCVQAWNNPDPRKYRSRYGGPNETKCDPAKNEAECKAKVPTGTYKK